MGNCCSPGCRLWCLWWSFCAVFFPTRCLEWDLELNWVSFWGVSYLHFNILQISCRYRCQTTLVYSRCTAMRTNTGTLQRPIPNHSRVQQVYWYGGKHQDTSKWVKSPYITEPEDRLISICTVKTPIFGTSAWPNNAAKIRPLPKELSVQSLHHLQSNNIYSSYQCPAKHRSWPRGYKTFFMLNSIKQENLNAHKYKRIKIFGFL